MKAPNGEKVDGSMILGTVVIGTVFASVAWGVTALLDKAKYEYESYRFKNKLQKELLD